MAARKVGTCDGYSWRQTYDEFTFITPLPKGASAKTVHVDVKNRYLKVQIEERIIVQGCLSTTEHVLLSFSHRRITEGSKSSTIGEVEITMRRVLEYTCDLRGCVRLGSCTEIPDHYRRSGIVSLVLYTYRGLAGVGRRRRVCVVYK
eukprot:1192877-Amorphochlora_amoeboformis.AAC.1